MARKVRSVMSADDDAITPAEEADVYKVFDGIKKLAELDRRGLNDSPDADAIRDEMDGPWLKLTDKEKRLVGKFSESLGYPGDPRDWRIEGTTANLEVERLLRKTTLWQSIALIMGAISIVSFLVFSSQGHSILGYNDVMIISPVVLMWACYFRAESLRIRLKVYTEEN
jgi:hypothetical protein